MKNRKRALHALETDYALPRQAAIAQALGTEILSGHLKPGDRIYLEDLTRRFKVSRVVMREVIKTLTAKGMVYSKPRLGTVVTDSTGWQWLDASVLEWRIRLGADQSFIEQITQVRMAVEPLNASLAAQSHTRKDIARLRECIAGMRECDGDHARFFRADLAFHAALGAMSGNQLLVSLNSIIKIVLQFLLERSAVGVKALEKDYSRDTKRHARIVDAIEAGDSAGAARAMLQVIAEGQYFASQPTRKRK